MEFATHSSEEKGCNVITPSIAADSSFGIVKSVCESAVSSSTTLPEKEAAATAATHKSKHAGKANVSFDSRPKVEPEIKVDELLGSVITHAYPGVRTSARVIQKMKQDQSRPLTPPPCEREQKHKEDKSVHKTPSQVRSQKPIWSNVERNHFFDALNELGKDFESISNYINAKLKRKCSSDITFKSKDQVRQHYYQTFHKICKYVAFSDEIKKPAQELYGLINYGEMRRKLQFVTDKHFFKLRSLVYHGHIIVRCKGKNIRIKTPSCKALRRLNQLDDSLDDIRLPAKIEVVLNPANMESFGRVQSIAQNPRARILVPLHKKLVDLIRTFQHKWRSAEMNLAAEELKIFPAPNTTTAVLANCHHADQGHISAETPAEKMATPVAVAYHDPPICFLPKPGAVIHRPLLNITEHLNSVKICLAAYEERMGVKVRGETLSIERSSHKRQRTESGSEKRSPDAKKNKHMGGSNTEKAEVHIVEEYQTTVKSEAPLFTFENAQQNEELTEELNDLLSDAETAKEEDKRDGAVVAVKIDNASAEVLATNATSNNAAPVVTTNTATATLQTKAKRGGSGGSGSSSVKSANSRMANSFKPLISEAALNSIRKGWTVANAADISIGDLYVVLGQDTKLELDYFWTKHAEPQPAASTEAVSSMFLRKQNGMPYNPSECEDSQLFEQITKSAVSNKLKHLLLVANLSERIRKRQCSCGHTCEKSVAKARIERDLAAKTFLSPKTYLPAASNGDGDVFRQPIVPLRRSVINVDSMRQLSMNSRSRLNRQVLVQRLLLPSGANHAELMEMHGQGNSILERIKSAEGFRLNSSGTYMPAPGESASTSANSNSWQQPTTAPELNYEQSAAYTSTSAEGLSLPILDADIVEKDQQQIPDMLSSKLEDIKNAKANSTTDTEEQQSSELSTESSKIDSAFDDNTSCSLFSGLSPMHIMRESTSNSRWLEENLNDFSLTSLLGHLDEINSNRDSANPSSNLSVISESSVDYMTKFQEITALIRSQEND